MTRKASSEEAIHVLGVNAQQPGDIRRGHQGLGAVQVGGRERLGRTLHQARAAYRNSAAPHRASRVEKAFSGATRGDTWPKR
jgi:hypothetical protein